MAQVTALSSVDEEAEERQADVMFYRLEGPWFFGSVARIGTVLERVADKMGSRILLGAGTVLDAQTCRAALLAGAEFIVSPTVNVEVIEVCKRAVIGKHVGNDVGYGHVVEDVIVGALRQDPQPGLQDETVSVEMITHAKPLRLCDNAVELALAPVDTVDCQRRVFADQLVKINVAIRAQRFKPELEKLVHPLRAVKPHNGKLVRPKRRLQNPRTPLLPRHDRHLYAPQLLTLSAT